MAKFPEAEVRRFRDVFICRKCKSKIKASSMKIIKGRIKCRRCDGRAFKAVRKK